MGSGGASASETFTHAYKDRLAQPVLSLSLNGEHYAKDGKPAGKMILGGIDARFGGISWYPLYPQTMSTIGDRERPYSIGPVTSISIKGKNVFTMPRTLLNYPPADAMAIATSTPLMVVNMKTLQGIAMANDIKIDHIPIQSCSEMIVVPIDCQAQVFPVTITIESESGREDNIRISDYIIPLPGKPNQCMLAFAGRDVPEGLTDNLLKFNLIAGTSLFRNKGLVFNLGGAIDEEEKQPSTIPNKATIDQFDDDYVIYRKNNIDVDFEEKAAMVASPSEDKNLITDMAQGLMSNFVQGLIGGASAPAAPQAPSKFQEEEEDYSFVEVPEVPDILKPLLERQRLLKEQQEADRLGAPQKPQAPIVQSPPRKQTNAPAPIPAPAAFFPVQDSKPMQRFEFSQPSAAPVARHVKKPSTSTATPQKRGEYAVGIAHILADRL